LILPIKGWDVIFFYFLGEKSPARVAKVSAVAGSRLLFEPCNLLFLFCFVLFDIFQKKNPVTFFLLRETVLNYRCNV